MLNLSLAAIAQGGERAVWEIPPEESLWEDADLGLVRPVHVEIDARPIGDAGVLVWGRIRATVQLECRRCLTAVEHTVDEPIDLVFEALGEDEADEMAGEVYPLPPRGDELDLSEAVREQLLLHVPAFVVCDEACRGLCPHCGTDLNQASCACVSAPQPSTWDALKNLKFD